MDFGELTRRVILVGVMKGEGHLSHEPRDDDRRGRETDENNLLSFEAPFASPSSPKIAAKLENIAIRTSTRITTPLSS